MVSFKYIVLSDHLEGAHFARTKRGNVVRFSGFSRKTNHLSSFLRAKRAKSIKIGFDLNSCFLAPKY
jgi:hypothetical protein